MTEISTSSVMALRNAILQKNAALRDVASPGATPGMLDGVQGATIGKPQGFTSALQDALKTVNGLQQESNAAATAFERGETTDIAAVMLAKQKASVGFETTLQVRNKLLSAYKEIMSMPV